MRRAVWIVGVSALLVATPAFGQDEAMARFDRGVQLYEAENYEGALVEFNTAYKLSRNYKLLYNIGVCQNAIKNYPNAVESFTTYLSEGGAEVSEARRADVTARLAKLALMVSRVRVTTNAPTGATLTIDDVPSGTTPLPETVTVKIGRRQFAIHSNGKVATKTVDVTSGEQSSPVSLTLVDPVVAPPPAAVRVERSPVVPSAREPAPFPWAFWGLTAVLGGATVVTGVLAVDARNDLADRRATFGVEKGALEDGASSARRLGLVTDILLGGSLLSAAASTYLTVRWLGKKNAAPGSVSGIRILPIAIGYERSF